MKKFLFFILFNILMVFMVSGCGEESKENEKTIPITPTIAKYVGSYDMTFFATKPTGLGAMGSMTTDCAKAGELGILKSVETEPSDVSKECKLNGAINKDIANIIGQQAVIKYDEKNGLTTIETKLQIWHGALSMYPNDTYQYTKYTAIPKANITDKGINIDRATAVKGVSGRHLTAKSENSKSEFKITKMDNGDLYVELNLIDKATLIGNVNAPIYVILKKKSNTPEAIDPNSLFKATTGIEGADNIYKGFKPTPDEATAKYYGKLIISGGKLST